MTTAKTPAKTAARKPAVKKPQDRKPKAEELTDVATITAQGLTIAIEQDRMDDIEILELIVMIESGEAQYMTSFLRLAFGEEQYEQIKEHLKNEDGRVTITALAEFFEDAQAAMGKLSAAAKA